MELGRSRIDPTLVHEGVWTEFVIESSDREPVVIKLKMAMANTDLNARYKAALRKSMEPYERLMAIYKKASDIPPALAEKVNAAGRRVFLESIVVDWEGPTKDGQPIPYSVEAAEMLFDEYPELLAQAEAEAGKFQRYRVAILEDAAGNSTPA